jgi:hypothetical protein
MNDLSKLVGYFAHDEELESRFAVLPLSSMTHEQFDVAGEQITVIRDLLAPDECQALMEALEGQRQVPVGDDGYAQHYLPGQPVCSGRATMYSESIAQRLFQRIQSLLRPAPNRYGQGEQLLPCGVNPALRFIDYPSAGYLVPHYDFPYKASERSLTLYSLVLFLTSNVDEGGTRFIREYRENDDSDWLRPATKDEVLACVYPRAGCALLFPHHVLHEGQATRTRKTIIRTDILYGEQI